MLNNNSSWMLFACCIPVKGSKRSLIYDLQRNRYFFIPNALYQMIQDHEGTSVPATKAAYNNEYDTIIDDYIALLFQYELAFYTDTPQDFPKLSLEWRSPFHITNAIIDTHAQSQHAYNNIIPQLCELGCAYLQVRCYEPLPIIELVDILAASNISRLRSIELVIPYSENITVPMLTTLISTNKRLNSIIIHSAPQEDRTWNTDLNASIVHITDVIDSATHCGYISAAHFRTNIEVFTEAQAHNSCLNRKVGIDVDGNIKNCPSATINYGNVKVTPIKDVVATTAFRQLWDISKDQVNVCKDCEFRYMCMDCRMFVADPNDLYSKPSRCAYDPYTATWNSEENNPQSKQFRKLELSSM